MKKGAYKQLNLTHLEAALPHVLDAARREQWTYETLLAPGAGGRVGWTRAEGYRPAAQSGTHSWEKDAGWVRFHLPADALRAQTAGTGGSLLCANLYQCGLPRPSWNRENTLEPSVGGSSTRSGTFGALYHTSRARTGPGKCVASWPHTAAPAALYRAQFAGHRRSRLQQAVTGAGSPLL